MMTGIWFVALLFNIFFVLNRTVLNVLTELCSIPYIFVFRITLLKVLFLPLRRLQPVDWARRDCVTIVSLAH